MVLLVKPSQKLQSQKFICHYLENPEFITIATIYYEIDLYSNGEGGLWERRQIFTTILSKSSTDPKCFQGKRVPLDLFLEKGLSTQIYPKC